MIIIIHRSVIKRTVISIISTCRVSSQICQVHLHHYKKEEKKKNWSIILPSSSPLINYIASSSPSLLDDGFLASAMRRSLFIF